MGEVEEDLCENHLVAMIVGEEEIAVFAAGCMGGDEDIMQALGFIADILGQIDVICKGKVFPRSKVRERGWRKYA